MGEKLDVEKEADYECFFHFFITILDVGGFSKRFNEFPAMPGTVFVWFQ